jgi:hypothetical protein
MIYKVVFGYYYEIKNIETVVIKNKLSLK